MQNKASSVNFIFKYDPGEEKNQVTSGITGNGVYRGIYMMKVMFWFINWEKCAKIKYYIVLFYEELGKSTKH